MEQKKERKPRKIIAYTKKWEKMADAEARCFCPEIKPCADCGAPVVSGYCCPRCKSANP